MAESEDFKMRQAYHIAKKVYLFGNEACLSKEYNQQYYIISIISSYFNNNYGRRRD
jgi:hypothetical protein